MRSDMLLILGPYDNLDIYNIQWLDVMDAHVFNGLIIRYSLSEQMVNISNCDISFIAQK
jgi:hypothetical protein